MTREEAQAEAVMRWGEDDAAVWETPDTQLGPCCVGTWELYRDFASGGNPHVHFIEHGQGNTWEAAFADADRRAAAKEERG